MTDARMHRQKAYDLKKTGPEEETKIDLNLMKNAFQGKVQQKKNKTKRKKLIYLRKYFINF